MSLGFCGVSGHLTESKMLKKSNELEVREDDAFANDPLEREQPMKRLAALVQRIQQPSGLSIAASRGWSETAFTRLWGTHLESKGTLPRLHVNAGENDIVDDPVLASLGAMRRLVQVQLKG